MYFPLKVEVNIFISSKPLIHMRHTFITLIISLTILFSGIQAQVVWPGDINNNGIVNGVDLLYWGMAFGSTGPARNEVSTDWQAYPISAPWNQTLPNGLNYAYADCNGDGIINEDDFDEAIEENVGETHGQLGPEGFVNAPAMAPAPKLLLQTNTPIVQPGATVNIDLSFAPNSTAVAPFYGMAFTMKYDPELLEDDDGPDFDLAESSWVASDGSYVQEFLVESEGDGSGMLALTRTNQRTIPTQTGIIGNFTIVIEDIILGLEKDTFTLAIDSIRFISEGFQTIPAITDKIEIVISNETNPNTDSTGVIVDLDDPKNSLLDGIKIFPNPVSHQLFVQTDRPIEKMVLYDQMGRTIPIQSNILNEGLSTIPIGQLENGLYWIHMIIDNQIFIKRIIYLTKT